MRSNADPEVASGVRDAGIHRLRTAGDRNLQCSPMNSRLQTSLAKIPAKSLLIPCWLSFAFLNDANTLSVCGLEHDIHKIPAKSLLIPCFACGKRIDRRCLCGLSLRVQQNRLFFSLLPGNSPGYIVRRPPATNLELDRRLIYTNFERKLAPDGNSRPAEVRYAPAARDFDLSGCGSGKGMICA